MEGSLIADISASIKSVCSASKLYSSVKKSAIPKTRYISKIWNFATFVTLAALKTDGVTKALQSLGFS